MPITAETLIAQMAWAARNGLTEYIVEQDGNRVTLVLNSAGQGGGADEAAALTPVPSAASPDVTTGLHVVAAPLTGLCYLAQDADAAPFVEIGDQVVEGQTLCLIEAMKVMMAVTADCTGTVAEICVANNTQVEAGQPLVKVKT